MADAPPPAAAAGGEVQIETDPEVWLILRNACIILTLRDIKFVDDSGDSAIGDDV